MIGMQLANYRIEEKLGQGGMGVVYKAVDLSLDRRVAIKVLSPELSRDPELIERFHAEAKALANLNHFNVAIIYSFLNIQGSYLIVMEYLEGEGFDQMIRRRGRIPYEEAVPLFKQALLGIGFAHRMGIIHRDIKPSNIMVNRNGIVKVMDFGIAKVLGGQRLTRTGAQMGTVAYMSPEQICNQAVDTRADIYSLGVTLYEMLTGHLPFTSQSEFQLMSAHVHTPPPRPSRYCPQIPRGIEDAVLRALEKNPGSRFQTVEEFGAALEHPEGLGKAVPQVAAAAAPAIHAPSAEQASPARSSPRKPPPAVKPSPPPQRAPAGGVRVLARPSPAPVTTRHRTPVYKFSALALGVAGLFAWLFWALYKESVPMLLIFAVLLYFLPILIAAALLKRNGATVVRINMLRGWTGVGWVEAMKQALADDD